MKICFISPKAYPLFNSKIKATIGGAEVQLYMLAKELAKKKELDVHFLVADYGQEEVERYAHISIWKSLDFNSNKLIQIWKFFKVFRKINADIYIQRTLTPESGIIALYCRLKKKKFVYMVAHDKETDGTDELYKGRVKTFLAQLTFKFADVIIVQNEYQKKNLIDLNFYKVKLLLSSWSIPKRKDKQGKHILWVGRSVEWKRPEIFLELAKSFLEERFVLICPPSTEDPNYVKDIEQQVSSLKNVEFYPGIPFKEINSFFENAKVYVITSKQEGFSNSMLQAMREGVPVLSLSVNPNNVITKYKTGIYCSNKVDELKEGLEELLLNKEMYNHMSDSAYRYVQDNHDITVNASKFLKILYEI